MTGREYLNILKKELAEKNHCKAAKVYCYHCKYFEYNNGLALNSVGSAKCEMLKKKVYATQVCKKFKFWG